MLFYVIKKDLFVIEGKKPRPGLPTTIAKIYRVTSLLWGDYRFLDDSQNLEIDFTIMAVLYFYSFSQLGTALVYNPVMAIWSVFATYSLLTIIFYEVFVLGISFN